MQPSQVKAIITGDDYSTSDPTTIFLDGRNSYTDSYPLTYLWEVVSGSSFIIDNPTYPTSEITYLNVTGDTIVRLTVTDAVGNSDTDEVTITITSVENIIFIVDRPNGLLEGYIRVSNGVPNSLIRLNFEIFDNGFDDLLELDEENGSYSEVLSMHHIMDTHDFTLDSNGRCMIKYSAQVEEIFHFTTRFMLYDNGDLPDPDMFTISFRGNPEEPIGY